MKIFFPVENNAGLDSKLDNRFARAAFFLIYDTESQQVVYTAENEFGQMQHGVGLKVGALVVEKGCTAAIGAQPGPKAVAILEKGNVKMLAAYESTVKEALERYKAELS